MVACLLKTHKTLFCEKKHKPPPLCEGIQDILGSRIPWPVTGFQSLDVSGTWILDCNR